MTGSSGWVRFRARLSHRCAIIAALSLTSLVQPLMLGDHPGIPRQTGFTFYRLPRNNGPGTLGLEPSSESLLRVTGEVLTHAASIYETEATLSSGGRG